MLFPVRPQEERSPLLDQPTGSKKDYIGDPKHQIDTTPKKIIVDDAWLATETPRQSCQSQSVCSPTSRISATPVKTETEGEVQESRIKIELDVDQMSPDQVLYYYASKGDVEGIRESHGKGARINVDCDGDGDEPLGGNEPFSQNYPIHAAAEGGHLDAINELIELKADLEVCNRLGSTPLLRACGNNHLEVVQRLLREGANPFAVNKVGNTGLHIAAYGGFTEVARCLLEFSAAPCLQSQNLVGQTPVQIAQMASVSTLQIFQKYKKRKEKAKETSISFVDSLPIPDPAVATQQDSKENQSESEFEFLRPNIVDFPKIIITEDEKITPMSTPEKPKAPEHSKQYLDPSRSESDRSYPSTPSKSSSIVIDRGRTLSCDQFRTPSRNKSPSSATKRQKNSRSRSKAERNRSRVNHLSAILAS